jgi:hypothetical protein
VFHTKEQKQKRYLSCAAGLALTLVVFFNAR